MWDVISRVGPVLSCAEWLARGVGGLLECTPRPLCPGCATCPGAMRGLHVVTRCCCCRSWWTWSGGGDGPQPVSCVPWAVESRPGVCLYACLVW